MDKTRSYSWGKLKQNMRLMPITYRHKVSPLTSLKATERILLGKKGPLALHEGSENTVLLMATDTAKSTSKISQDNGYINKNQCSFLMLY